MKHRPIRIGIFIGVIFIAAVGCSLYMLYTGILSLNHPSSKLYPVRGVDVSSYQGVIDWDTLSKQDIDFAFIKATEGSSFQDKYFHSNWEDACNSSLEIGAYHFFSFDSSGDTQADNFIHTVPKKEGTLPPVIDIEYYGDKAKNPPGRESTQIQLNMLLSRLETYYAKKPILYCTHNSYERYIKDSYPENPIWIRDVYMTPHLPDKRKWTFWQYSSHTILKGYNGKEKYIDMNVFNGSQSDWDSFIKAA